MIDMDSVVMLDSLLEVYSVDTLPTVSIANDGTLMKCNIDPLPADPPKVRCGSRLLVVRVDLIDPIIPASEVRSDILALIFPPSR